MKLLKLLIDLVYFATRHDLKIRADVGWSWNAAVVAALLFIGPTGVVRGQTARVWGDNFFGEFGYAGGICDTELPVPVGKLNNLVAISAGGYHSLALNIYGNVFAWGSGRYAPPSDIDACQSNIPVKINELTNVAAIAAGSDWDVALKKNGTVWIWGSITSSEVPAVVSGLTGVLAISASNALKSDGTVWTLGTVPVKVASLTGVVAIAGFDHSLALKGDGTVWAWGPNESGQLGDGTFTNSSVPVAVSGPTGVVAIAAGYSHSLALKGDGTVWAWGSNHSNQLGNGSDIDSNVPVQVSNLTGMTAVAAGAWQSLALANDGTAWEWGGRSDGFSGGVPSGGVPPRRVSDVNGALAIAGGVNHALVMVTKEVPALVAPTPFESIFTGHSYKIEWTVDGVPAGSLFDVQYSTDEGNSYNPVPGCAGLATSARSCVWVAPGPPMSFVGRMRVTVYLPGSKTYSATSGNFDIVEGSTSMTLWTPNGGVNVAIGSTQIIGWGFSRRAVARVNIDVSRDSGATWTRIFTNLWNNGISAWKVTGPATSKARIRVSWAANQEVNDISDIDFTIAQPFLKIAAPNAASVNWAAGAQRAVAWNTNMDSAAKVRLLLSTDGGATFPIMLAASVNNRKSQIVTVPNVTTNRARLRIESIDNPTIGDVSDVNFTIAAPTITVIKPNGGEQWKKGTAQTIRWNSNLGDQGRVSIDLSTNGGVSWQALRGSTPNDGNEQVVLPNVVSNQCRMRITWLDDPAVNDRSNANFAIVP